MVARRRLFVTVLSAACSVVGLLAAPGASATGGTADARPAVAGCDSQLSFGATTPCDFADAGTAVYSVLVTGPDRLRVRAAEPTFTANPSVQVRTASDGLVCAHDGSDQFDCPIAAAGTYTVEVTLATAGTIYTTVDSVRHPSTCAPPADLSVTAPTIPIDIADPGASVCSYLADTRANDVLRYAFQSNADDPLQITVYNSAGAPECSVSPLFSAAECTLGGGSNFRMFVNWTFDAARSTQLHATRLSHPAGCQSSAPDAFGTALSRAARVAAFTVRCFTAPVDAGHPLVIQAVAAASTRVLTWSVRTPSGAVACTGGTNSGAIACPAPVAGRYALFVAGPTGSSGGPTTAVSALLAAALDSAGCTPLPGTAFGAAAQVGTLATSGQVDCLTFAGSGGHAIRITPWSVNQHAGFMLVDPNGAQVCRASIRTTCVLPDITGTYRLLVFGVNPSGPVDYRVWATDLNSTAGCTPTTADAFGVAPNRIGPVDDQTTNQCWEFSATKGDSYLASLAVASGTLFGRLRVAQVHGSLVCDTTISSHTGCDIPRTGTYVIYAEQYTDVYDASQDAVVRVGLWRLDQPAGCVPARVSFAAPAIDGSFDGPDEVDCALVTTPAADVLAINAGGPPNLSVQHQVYALNGRRKCLVYPGGDCRLGSAGTYAVLTYSVQQQVTPYTMSVRSVIQHRGCPESGPSAFGSVPANDFTVEPGVPACVVFTRTAPAGSLILRVQSNSPGPVRYALHNGTRRRICAGVPGLRPCRMPGTGPFVLVLYGASSATGSAAAYSASESSGCAAPPSFGFDARPENGVIRRPGQVDCIDLGASSAPRFLRLAAARVPAGAVLHLSVVDASGRQRCSWSTADYFRALACTPRKYLDVRLLTWLEDGPSVTTGRYAVHLWDLYQASGCTKLGWSPHGFGEVVGQFADANDQDCYQFSVPAGTSFQITADDPDNASTPPPWVDVRTPDGRLQCEINRTGTCTLPEEATYRMIVFPRSGEADYLDRYRVVGSGI